MAVEDLLAYTCRKCAGEHKEVRRLAETKNLARLHAQNKAETSCFECGATLRAGPRWWMCILEAIPHECRSLQHPPWGPSCEAGERRV